MDSNSMICPKDGAPLAQQSRHGLDVQACATCNGMWLEYDELDQLEDQAYDQDELKGSLMVNSFPTNYKCPRCGKPLQQFQYRLHDLRLEFCEDGHGFWLDQDEAERVLDIMRQRERDMERKFSVEAEFAGLLRRTWRSITGGGPPAKT